MQLLGGGFGRIDGIDGVNEQGALGVFLLLIILFLPGGLGSLALRLRPGGAKWVRRWKSLNDRAA